MIIQNLDWRSRFVDWGRSQGAAMGTTLNNFHLQYFLSMVSSKIKNLFVGKIINSCHVDYTLSGVFPPRLITCASRRFRLRESLFPNIANGFVLKYLCKYANMQTWDVDWPISLFLAKMYWHAPAGNRLTLNKITFEAVPYIWATGINFTSASLEIRCAQ